MSKEKIQLMLIHGGVTFKNKSNYINHLKTREISIEKKIRWSDAYLEKELEKELQIIKPQMPLKENAKYEEWKIHFEKHFPYLKNNIILIGQSLGGIFLAKYLSENKFPKKILSVYLICPPFDNTDSTEDLVGGFKLKSDLSLIEKNCKNTTLMFSKTDEIVPVSHAIKYQKKLPNTKIIIYDDKNGHFKIEKFPEIIKMIKENLKSLK